MASDCNPSSQFEPMPFPQCRMGRERPDAPDSHFQITGVRAEVLMRTGWAALSARKGAYNNKAYVSPYVIRWLGIQNSKYVALPEEWVKKTLTKTSVRKPFIMERLK